MEITDATGPPADQPPPLAKGARVTGPARSQLIARIVALYQSGQTIRDIRDTTGRSYGFVQRVLTESPVQTRPRGGSIRRGSTTPATAP